MKTNPRLLLIAPMLLISSIAIGAPCPFDNAKNCTVQRDILNYKSSTGLKSYAPTNYDHRMSGETNVYNQNFVQPYTDSVNAPGQIKLMLKASPGTGQDFLAGEIMTRINVEQPPFKGSSKIDPWTTKAIKHGYLEVKVKLPKCETSLDGKCQTNPNDTSYSKGLWPAIWMMPTDDAIWPKDGEIDIMEAYAANQPLMNQSTIYLHFYGNDPKCSFNDCVGAGFFLGAPSVNGGKLYDNFHTWGFEWEPDPQSTSGGHIITTYFDNIKSSGPTRTDTLPADGKGGLARGFNNPNGGYYLIVNLAVGGPYAGAPHSQLDTSAMYIQSIKAYDVGGSGSTPPPPPPPTGTCDVPVNIQQLVSSDMRQITLAWEAPKNTTGVTAYKVKDWQKNTMWTGTTPTQRAFQDTTLPGKAGSYTYYLSTVCGSKTSTDVTYQAKVGQ